jgi:hypothetical protein
VTDGGEFTRKRRSELPDSVVADLRSDDRRRCALARLDDAEGPLPITDLARQLAATERGEPVDDVPTDAVGTVRRDLFETHLPKLTATEVVEYDSQVGTVELATDDERLFVDNGG